MQKPSNTEMAIKIIEQGVAQKDKSVVYELVKENYIQHNPTVPDGRKGLLAMIDRIINGQLPTPVIKVKRALAEGDYVVLHSDFDWGGRKAVFEIFRFEDGLATEHWSGIQNHPEQTANGHSMVDGATAIKDRDKTESNKALIKEFLEKVFIAGQFNKLRDFFDGDKYLQHNPMIADGVSGLEQGLKEMQKKGIKIEFHKIHQIIGEGNFVLTLSEGKFDGKPTAFFDLFRVENGKIAEHWDVVQEVPVQMPHNNGMFSLSLYRRLGGYDAIAGFVDLAFPRVAAHPELSHFFRGHATESQYRQRQLIVDRLCAATGGPVIYIGRPLESVHRGLGITEANWNTFMKIITTAMDERNFPEAAKKEFIEIFEKQFRAATIEGELKE